MQLRYAEDSVYPPSRQLREGDFISNGLRGYSILEYPFGGYLGAYQCTRVNVIEARLTKGGGLKIWLKIGQSPWCPIRPRAVFRTRPRTNPETIYEYNLNGQAVRVTGTIGGIAAMGDDSALFAVSEGSLAVTASNGDATEVHQGAIVLAGPEGIKRFPAPKPEFKINWRGDYGQFIFPMGVYLTADGRPVNSLEWIYKPSRVVVETITGEQVEKIVRTYPHPNVRESR